MNVAALSASPMPVTGNSSLSYPRAKLQLCKPAMFKILLFLQSPRPKTPVNRTPHRSRSTTPSRAD